MRQRSRIALWGTGLRPGDEGGDLLVREGDIVLVVLDTGGHVEVPGRHLPRLYLEADPPRPAPGVIVRQQRHRADAIGIVAAGTRFEEDRRHVSRKRGG